MKTISKIMLGIVLGTIITFTSNAQPKSEIPEDNQSRINWADADTLYTFQLDQQTNKWIFFQREIRRFNDKNLPTENYVQEWDKNSGSWTNYLRVNYTYDSYGNEIEEIKQAWDKAFDNWVNAELKTTTYKGKRKEEILFQQWKKPSNEWFNVMKYLLQYNENGIENTITIKLYNGISKTWDNHKRFLMEFENIFLPPSTVVAESWKYEHWETNGKYEIQYNGRGYKTLETRYTWNKSNNEWYEGIQKEMMYDKKGNQIEYIESKFNFTDKNWIKFNRNTAAYNELGYMLEKTEYVWNRDTKQWEIAGQYKFTTETKI